MLERSRLETHQPVQESRTQPQRRRRLHRMEDKGEQYQLLTSINHTTKALAFSKLKIAILRTMDPGSYKGIDPLEDKEHRENNNIDYRVLQDESVNYILSKQKFEQTPNLTPEVYSFKEEYDVLKDEHEEEFEDFIEEFLKDDSYISDAIQEEIQQAESFQRELSFLTSRKNYLSLSKEIAVLKANLHDAKERIDTNTTFEEIYLKNLHQDHAELFEQAKQNLQHIFHSDIAHTLTDSEPTEPRSQKKLLEELYAIEDKINNYTEIIADECTKDHCLVETATDELFQKLPYENNLRINLAQHKIFTRLESHYEHRSEALENLADLNKQHSKLETKRKNINAILQKRHFHPTGNRDPEHYERENLLESIHATKEKQQRIHGQKISLESKVKEYEHLPKFAHEKKVQLHLLRQVVLTGYRVHNVCEEISESVTVLKSNVHMLHTDSYLKRLETIFFDIQSYISDKLHGIEQNLNIHIMHHEPLISDADKTTLKAKVEDALLETQIILAEIKEFPSYDDHFNSLEKELQQLQQLRDHL